MNWQPQLKYSYHGNMMRQVTVDHISLNIMEKSWGKKKHFYMDSATRKDALDSESSRLICYILMLPAINSPKISPICPTFISRGEFPFIHQYIRSLVMGLEVAERVSDSLARAH